MKATGYCRLVEPAARSSRLSREVLRALIPGQKLADPFGRMVRQRARTSASQAWRIDVAELGGLDELAAARRPPSSHPAKVQFLRPIAIQRTVANFAEATP